MSKIKVLRITSILITASFLASCSMLNKQPKFINPNELESEDVSESDVNGVGALDGGGTFKPKFTTGDIEDFHENVVFAPEDPNVAFSPVKAGGNMKVLETWTKDYKKAINSARDEGKPLMVWFSNSRGSANSNQLSEELFSQSDFNTWAGQNFSTLLVDKADTINTGSISEEQLRRNEKYYEDIKKRFSIRGTPEVIVLDFNGEVFARYRGYTAGRSQFYWNRLKIAQQGAKLSYGMWREGMESRGYRMWHSIGGEKSKFAKMLSVDGETVSLVTPEGKRYKTSLNSFSNLDQKWVKEQQAGE